MLKFYNLLILILISGVTSFGQTTTQCDSIKIYSQEFDTAFQNEFNAIKTDTALAIRHCYSTNGCSRTYGILCWKEDGVYKFKKIEKDGKRIRFVQNLDEKLRKDLISFYEDEVYLAPDVDLTKDLYISDGPITRVLYKMPGKCWNFNYRHTSPYSTDKRVLWVNKIESFIKIDGKRTTN